MVRTKITGRLICTFFRLDPHEVKGEQNRDKNWMIKPVLFFVNAISTRSAWDSFGYFFRTTRVILNFFPFFEYRMKNVIKCLCLK